LSASLEFAQQQEGGLVLGVQGDGALESGDGVGEAVNLRKGEAELIAGIG
jgi:hypothetical protein